MRKMWIAEHEEEAMRKNTLAALTLAAVGTVGLGLAAASTADAGTVFVAPEATTAKPAADRAHHLTVVHDPPALYVEARGVGLPAVLRAIGAKVGFAVVDAGAGRPDLTVSLTGKRLKAVLRDLLRGENHVLVYGEGDGAAGNRVATAPVATIVLLGPSLARAGGRGVDVDQGSGPTTTAPVIAIHPVPPSPRVTAPIGLDPSRRGLEPSSRPAEGEAASPEPRLTRSAQRSMVSATAPLDAPDPTTVEARILADVRVMVDAARRATLGGRP